MSTNEGDHWAMEERDEVERRLTAAMLPPGSGASFAATRHAGLARIEPLTVAAEAWLHEHAGDEASWNGVALVVEMRYFPGLADAIIAAGFTFERDARPN